MYQRFKEGSVIWVVSSVKKKKGGHNVRGICLSKEKVSSLYRYPNGDVEVVLKSGHKTCLRTERNKVGPWGYLTRSEADQKVLILKEYLRRKLKYNIELLQQLLRSVEESRVYVEDKDFSDQEGEPAKVHKIRGA